MAVHKHLVILPGIEYQGTDNNTGSHVNSIALESSKS